MGSGMTSRPVTGKTWTYPLLGGLIGLFIAWLTQISGGVRTDATKFFTGVLAGISISALVVAVYSYLRERSGGA